MITVATHQPPVGGARDVSLGSLRTCLTLLVVGHHAALAYHPYAPPLPRALNEGPLLWTAFPISDAARWARADLFVGFNDVFFMSLMFFISGVFAWPSLVRRGAAGFARERALKLGIPFVVSAALFAPLAYYATYVATGPNQPSSFAHQYLALDGWPAGPAWFLWVLLAFGLCAAGLFVIAPRWGVALGAISRRLSRRPIVYALALIAASALAYLPMAASFTPEHWTMLGPFSVQTSRVLHYAVYFFAGAGVGAFGLGQGLLARDGRLARRWALWIGAALVAFAFAIVMLLVILSTLATGGPSAALSAMGNLAFVLSCACSSLAFLAVFVRFGRTSHGAWASLGANAYGIYLVHYFCVSWLQLALLRASLPGSVKFALVFLGAVAVSWMLSALLRRVPAIARVV